MIFTGFGKHWGKGRVTFVVLVFLVVHEEEEEQERKLKNKRSKIAWRGNRWLVPVSLIILPTTTIGNNEAEDFNFYANHSYFPKQYVNQNTAQFCNFRFCNAVLQAKNV